MTILEQLYASSGSEVIHDTLQIRTTGLPVGGTISLSH